MSIEKLDLNFVRQEEKPYTMILNFVLQNIRHQSILATYVYLSSLPPDWKINKNQLCSHFKIGMEKLSQILTWLRKNHLISFERVRDEKGHFIKDASYILVKNGQEFLVHMSKSQTNTKSNKINVESTHGKNPVVDQTHIESMVLENNPVDNFKNVDNYVSTLGKNQSLEKPEPGSQKPINKNKYKKRDDDFEKNSELEKHRVYDSRSGVISGTMSEEYMTATKSNPSIVEEFFKSLPDHLRPSRFRNQQSIQNINQEASGF